MKPDVANGAGSPGGGEAVPHGGRLIEARRRFPDAPEPFVDLSTGINPHPYPIPDLPGELFTRLPEPEQVAALQAAAAEAYGAAGPELVAAAPGTQLLIELLPRLLPADTVSVLAPTYGEHAPAWARAGCEVRLVDEAAALAETRVAVLCNPNNPDGRRIEPEALLDLAARLANRGGHVVVDEAFADFATPPPSVAAYLPRPGLVVLRSFGKAYGLAGVRLGFALADSDLAARIRDALGPWAVSGVAAFLGRRALPDAAWRADTAARLTAEAARLDALLEAAGFEIVGGTPLFRLARHPRAADWATRLARAGLLVRAFAELPDRLRFGLPAEAAHWDRLERALANPDEQP